MLADQASCNVVEQPSDRGTATGVLLPLLRIYLRDRRAVVAILPSDQHIEEESIVQRTFERAFALLDGQHRILLLGITPNRAEPDYGWILAERPEADGTHRVSSFIEKPGPTLARFLFRRSAAWSSFMLAARADSLLALFERAAPRTLRILARAVREREGEPETLGRLYSTLPYVDFSRDLLQGATDRLRLLMVPQCGWTDLGTPMRLRQWMAAHPSKSRRFADEPTGAEQVALTQ
jgi:mannose-1-phosphate guanylyltransferase